MNVHKGEVVGVYGLIGAGRTELAMSVFGHSYGTKTTEQSVLRGKRYS